jgi:hypothetical protein
MQPGYEVIQAVRILRSELVDRPRLQFGRIQARGEKPDRHLHGGGRGLTWSGRRHRGLTRHGRHRYGLFCSWCELGVPAAAAA